MATIVGSSSSSNCLAKEGEEATVRDVLSTLDVPGERVMEIARQRKEAPVRGVLSKLGVPGERAAKIRGLGEEGGLGGLMTGLAAPGEHGMKKEEAASASAAAGTCAEHPCAEGRAVVVR
ncbi:hypothetical protein FOA52_012783 [Chlamydomonas sp. UWO 241]|nr:hypothetical protein FOA52_012783 [Chlamydomonas sp. UWO 241]